MYLPPSKPALEQKILRTNLVTYLWRHANQAVPLEINPVESGYQLDDGHYTVKWFIGPQVPDDITLAMVDTDDSEDDDVQENDSDDSDEEADEEADQEAFIDENNNLLDI